MSANWTDRPCRTGDQDSPTTTGGYRYRQYKGIKWRAHRAAYDEAYGDIPFGLLVLHHCDNPPCDEPTHLFLGTHAENMQDKTAKGRDPAKGRDITRLSEEDIQTIKERYGTPRPSMESLANEYGVNRSVIFRIVHEENDD